MTIDTGRLASAADRRPGHVAVGPEFRQPLPRLTKRVFTDLAIWMSGLGLLMGLAFPFFVVALGVPAEYVLTPRFFVATIGAGLLVGATNQFLSRAVVRLTTAVHAVEDGQGRDDPPQRHVRG